jgi:hypothetical protein
MPRHRERREKLKVRLSQLPYEKHGLPRAFTDRLQPADSTYLEDRIEYTYKFRPARPQQDLVLRQIRDAISKLNQDLDHGMLMCNHNIQVFPSTGSPPIWPPKFHQQRRHQVLHVLPRHEGISGNSTCIRHPPRGAAERRDYPCSP